MPFELDRSAALRRAGAGRAPEPRPAAVATAASGIMDMPALKPAEFEEIRGFAKRRFGLDLRQGKEELVSARLGKAMRKGGFRSFRDYLAAVESDRTGEALIGLINALTTNHTSFYREPHHFEFLNTDILPKFRPGSDLRIWSAACSTGEEPYSISCAVAQAWNGQTRGLRILATDISTRVLQKAKSGEFPELSLQPAPAVWLRSFFTRAGGEGLVVARREIASPIEFRRINLIEPIPFGDKFHVIFCRNVMIYFDKATQQGLVERLAAHLEPGGHLFVGHSESLAGVQHPLTYLRPAIYRYDGGKGRPVK